MYYFNYTIKYDLNSIIGYKHKLNKILTSKIKGTNSNLLFSSDL